MTLMADAVTPALIPETFRAYRHHGVAPYSDGRYAWPQEVKDTFPRRLQGIDVDASRPDLADALDSERFDATPAQWPGWRRERDRLVHEGKVRGWPKIYTSINPGGGYGVKAIMDACRNAGQSAPERWWVAWYAMPGGQPPTQLEVVAEIHAVTGIRLEPATIWGCQYFSGPAYDLTKVYGAPEWQ